LFGNFTLAASASFPLRDGEQTIVRGQLTLTNLSVTVLSFLQIPRSFGQPLLVVIGPVILAGRLRFAIPVGLGRSSFSGRAEVSVTVLNATSVSGTYSVIEASSSSPCETVSTSPTYSASTLTVSLSVTNTCTTAAAAQGLSTGAVVGIAVGGAVVAGVLIAVIAALWWRRQRALRSAAASARILSNQ